MKRLLFIPMYNCEKQIPRVITQLTPEITAHFQQLLMVDNRSPDSTLNTAIEAAKSLPIPVEIVKNSENYGLGGSHKVAFEYALTNGFEEVVVLHGDDQARVQDLLPVLQQDTSAHQCWLGARFAPGSSLIGYSAFRIFGNRVFNWLFSAVLFRTVYDLGSGLNLYQTSMLASRYYLNFPDDLTFNYAMVLAISGYKQDARFFPISWREEDQISNVKLFSQARRVLGMLAKYAFLRKSFLKKEMRMTPRDTYPFESQFKQGL
ncbi:MAG: glycosyltransferase family 2 protein [Armatimonadetes bacterium]|nr:glycosyltransferase family 2 protein [Armatimonadota bacterium]